jgi:hypothetical protein
MSVLVYDPFMKQHVIKTIVLPLVISRILRLSIDWLANMPATMIIGVGNGDHWTYVLCRCLSPFYHPIQIDVSTPIF